MVEIRLVGWWQDSQYRYGEEAVSVLYHAPFTGPHRFEAMVAYLHEVGHIATLPTLLQAGGSLWQTELAAWAVALQWVGCQYRDRAVDMALYALGTYQPSSRRKILKALKEEGKRWPFKRNTSQHG